MATDTKKSSAVKDYNDPTKTLSQLLKSYDLMMSPSQKGTKKAIEEHYYNSANEALAQGVPVEHIEQKVGLNPKQVVSGVSQNVSPEEMSQEDPKGIISKLLKTIPASSPVGFGGMKQDEQGNLTEQKAGMLASLIGTIFTGTPNPGARMDLQNMQIIADLNKTNAQAAGLKSGKSNAWLDFSREMAQPIAEAAMNGDVSGYVNADRRTKTAVSAILAENGVNIDDLVLGYGAEQKTMGNARIMEGKVTAGQAAQTLLDANYDEKTKSYVLPPSAHTELAISVARLLSPSGVIPQQMVEELRQKTAREGLAGAAIWLGFDPKEVGGSTQSVINYFAKVINRETTLAQKNRDNYLKGKTADYIGMEKSGGSQGGGEEKGGFDFSKMTVEQLKKRKAELTGGVK